MKNVVNATCRCFRPNIITTSVTYGSLGYYLYEKLNFVYEMGRYTPKFDIVKAGLVDRELSNWIWEVT